MVSKTIPRRTGSLREFASGVDDRHNPDDKRKLLPIFQREMDGKPSRMKQEFDKKKDEIERCSTPWRISWVSFAETRFIDSKSLGVREFRTGVQKLICLRGVTFGRRHWTPWVRDFCRGL